MRNFAKCLDLGPPAAAMTKADAVFLQGLGDDDMLHTLGRKEPLLGQIGNAAIAA